MVRLNHSMSRVDVGRVHLHVGKIELMGSGG